MCVCLFQPMNYIFYFRSYGFMAVFLFFNRGRSKVSKKVSEFDRYERMRKMEKEAEAEKRREKGFEKKRSGRPKTAAYFRPGNLYDDDEYGC